MAIVQDILITIRGGRDDGVPSDLCCPYCGQQDDEPETHLARVHPLPEWFVRQQESYRDRVVAAHKAAGSSYPGWSVA